MAGLYVHIPYCKAKCSYCDFYSRRDDGRMSQLCQALVDEYRLRRNELGESPVTTLYFGGGTPSSLPVDMLRGVVEGLEPLPFLEEFTLEVNPEDVTSESLQAWTSMGVNRISMGIQSLVDSELQGVGRRHTADEALRAIEIIQRSGIERISCDLIYGLPGQTLDSWRYSLTRLLNTGIGHLSAYSLSYEPGTLLHTRLQLGRVSPVADDIVADMYHLLIRLAAERGFEHYEISNFALPGQRSRHNGSYWKGVPYLGLGPSAHSFDGNLRRVNPYNTVEYLKRLPAFEIEDSDERDRINDTIVTALRTSDGLSLNRFPEGIQRQILAQGRHHIDSGALHCDNGCLIIPERHWLVSDAIMRDLLIDEL